MFSSENMNNLKKRLAKGLSNALSELKNQYIIFRAFLQKI